MFCTSISKYTIDKHDAVMEETVYHNTVRQEFVEKIPANCKKTFTQHTFFTCWNIKHVDQIDMAENSPNVTMTGRSQNQIRIEVIKCNNLQLTQKINNWKDNEIQGDY